jgi:GNAT superfamily N-acetyltransferase
VVSAAFAWRSDVSSAELNRLHARAFGTRVHSDEEWDWSALLARHSLGWVTARDGVGLVGFVNVLWDGLVHAWLQDVMVEEYVRRRGVGTRLVEVATDGARVAGCEWLHVDFDDGLAPFYLDACGFAPTRAGLRRL